MATTGRQPYETTDVLPYGAGTGRLRPPASLGEPEKRAFLDLVTTCPATQFQPSDLPLLVRWAELVAMAETAAGEMAAGGMVTDGKISPWFGIHQQATKALSGLALRLRLGPQCRTRMAPKRVAASLSYFDQMEIARVEDEGEPDGEPQA
jgi:hypothetical protein